MKGEQGVLYVDSNEPDNIIDGLRPAVDRLVVAPLNISFGKADYYWLNVVGNEVMVERKQTGEALADIDSVDEQLQRHLHNCDELSLLVEGIGVPTASGVQTYKLSKDGKYFIQSFNYDKQPQLWARWESYKWALWHDAGVFVAETNHWSHTVHHILTCYNQSQKVEHSALKHYTHEHMKPWTRNLQVENLTRLRGLNIGEVTALKLIKEFKTFGGVMNASYTDLVGIMGGKFTKQFLMGIGRNI
jgi:hypothetical protein